MAIPHRKSSFLFTLLSLVAFPYANGYHSGAPNNKNVCTNLIPGHGDRQDGTTPYKLIVSENMNEQIVLNLVATSQVTFAGFIVQARDASDRAKVIDGEFAPSEGTQVKSCSSGKSNTWTHTSGQTKTQVSTVFKPPAGYNGSLIFLCTVVQVKAAYYDQIISEPLYFVNGIKVDEKKYNNNYNAASSGSAATTAQLSSPAINYEQCTDRMCIGLGDSANCLSDKTCLALLTAKQEQGSTDFTMSAKPNGDHKSKYYSMAFSDDNKMGDDLVVDCMSDSTGLVKVGLSYNHGKSNELLSGRQSIRLQDPIGQFADGIISCKWRLNRNFLVNNKQFDLVDKKYHILLAHGSLESDDGEKSYHELRILSSEPVNFAAVGVLSNRDLKYLVQIHGSLMIISWLFTVSVAIIFARYFKEAFSSKLICGIKIWFAFHRSLMVLSIVMMIIAQISIVYYVGGLRVSAHQILGSIALVFAFLQPLGALFRPHPDASNRWIFNWMHWFGGNAGHITATAAILLATRLKVISHADTFLYLVMGWIVFHVLVHFTYQFYSSCINGSKSQDMAMHEMRNGERVYVGKEARPASGSTFKSFLLAIYILVVLLIAILLVLLITGVIID